MFQDGDLLAITMRIGVDALDSSWSDRWGLIRHRVVRPMRAMRPANGIDIVSCVGIGGSLLLFFCSGVVDDPIDASLHARHVGRSMEEASRPPTSCRMNGSRDSECREIRRISNPCPDVPGFSAGGDIDRSKELSGSCPPALDGISHPQNAAPDDPRRASAMSAHDVVAARAERFFHPRTGLARTGDFDHHFVADRQSQVLVLEQRLGRAEIEARDHQIATQQFGCDIGHADQRCDHRKVLLLDQRDLPPPTRSGEGAAVPVETMVGDGPCVADGAHRLTSGRTQQDALESAMPRELTRELTKVCHRVIVGIRTPRSRDR
ncbi:hypothetical protein ABID77_004414 [Variovorax sp. PvP013]